MNTRKNFIWTLAAFLALGAGLGMTSVARAAGPGRPDRGYEGRTMAAAPVRAPAFRGRDFRGRNDRNSWGNDDRENDFRGRDDRDGGIRVGVVLGDRDEHPGMRWVDGYYTTQPQQVLVSPGHYETRYTPAVTQVQRDWYGRLITVVVRPAGYAQVWVPACYQTQSVQVWVPGHWERIPVDRDGGWHINIGGLIRF